MGILRTDRVSGLGGANAIKGSVKFSNGHALEIHPNSADFRLGSNDFTIEFWGNAIGTGNAIIFGLFENNPARRSYTFETRSNRALRFECWSDGSSSLKSLTSGTGVWELSTWHYFTVVRNGTALNIYVDGTSVANTTFDNASDSLYENTVEPLILGASKQSNVYYGDHGSLYISNFRLTNGTALYTGNFTPPNRELTKLSTTNVLCCQSSGDVLKEETGKILVTATNDTNDKPPEASRFTPNSPVGFSTTTDVGTQFGTTFDGVTTFDSQAYFVPPGGNTRERNRGRGIFACGYIAPARDDTIDFINIQSMGNAQGFGDLTEAKSQSAPAASSTRGTFSGGIIGSTNVIEFITIATTADAVDFGDLSSGTRSSAGGVSNQTRAVINGGDTPAATNVMEFFTIATTGNSADFGDAANVVNGKTGAASPTRGIFAGGYAPDRSQIEFITIASAGNATDFGECVEDRGMPAGGSNATRALLAGGEAPAGHRASIDTLLIATTGNATDFGDLQRTITEANGGASNEIRICFAGGNSPGQSPQNVIDVVNIVTTGAGADFGDLTLARRGTTGLSDSHSGL